MLDELTLGKCVDGELTEAEQREFLKLVETTDDGWRSVALAFLEEQAWGSVLAKPPTEENLQLVQPKATVRSGRSTSWSTMALGLMVALAAGLLVGDIWRDSQSQDTRQDVIVNKPVTSDVEPVNSDVHPLQEPQTPDAHYVMNVTGMDGEERQIKRPIYDQETFKQTPQYQPRFSADAEQQLRRQMGLRLERSESTRMIRLEDGSRILVPVRMIRATPIQ